MSWLFWNNFILGIVIGACSALGNDYDSSEKKAKTPVTHHKKEETKKPAKKAVDYQKVTKSNVKTVITKALGTKTNMDKKRIVGVDVIENAADDFKSKIILVKLNANENLTNKMTKGGMFEDTSDALKALSKFKNTSIYRVWWYYPLVDTYGNESDDVVMKLELSNETLKKINWDNFLSKNYPNIADFYWQHPSMPK